MRTVITLVILLQVCVAAVAADPAVQTPPVLPLFDGKSFAGWEGNLQAFRVGDGAIVGGQLDEPVPRNEYLCTTKIYRDFELRLKFKLLGKDVNAGVQFRSERVPGSNEMIGYQADMGQHYWGCLYDERRHKLLAGPTKEEQAKLIRPNDWNEYVIRAEGRRIQLWLNGQQTVDYTEPDATIPQEGVFGLQIHQGAPSEAWYKDITIQILDDNPSTRELAAPLIFSSFRGNGEDGLHLAWSEDGYTWTPLKNGKPLLRPEVGGGLMRDPQILQGPDGTFHMVWTTAWNKHGIGYANSKDLIHWSQQTLLDVMKNEPEARNVWAPELFYDAAKKQFLIFWASTIPGRFSETGKTGDGGYNHRMYYTLTADFERLEPARLLYEPGFNVIDATIVQDGKRFVMFLKDETRQPPAKNLRVATAETPAGPYGPPSPPITGPYWAEGPSAIKLGEKWFVYFDRYTEHRYGLVTSKDLVHWDEESDKVRFPADHRHGSVLHVSREVLEGLMKP